MMFESWLHLSPESIPANMPLSEKIDDYIAPHAKVLDLGCSVGRLYPYFVSRNCLYFGLDANKSAIEAAKEQYHDAQDSFFLDNAELLHFPDAFFDMIIAQGTLACMNLEGRVNTIAEMKRISTPEAILHITELDLQKNHSFYHAQMKLTGEYGTVIERLDGTKLGYATHHFNKKELLGLLCKDWVGIIEEHLPLTTRNKNRYLAHRMILKKKNALST